MSAPERPPIRNFPKGVHGLSKLEAGYGWTDCWNHHLEVYLCSIVGQHSPDRVGDRPKTAGALTDLFGESVSLDVSRRKVHVLGYQHDGTRSLRNRHGQRAEGLAVSRAKVFGGYGNHDRFSLSRESKNRSGCIADVAFDLLDTDALWH